MSSSPYSHHCAEHRGPEGTLVKQNQSITNSQINMSIQTESNLHYCGFRVCIRELKTPTAAEQSKILKSDQLRGGWQTEN